MWEDLCKTAIHPEAPPLQLREMRRAFYAGCAGMLNHVIDIFMNPSLTQEQCNAALDKVNDELQAFTMDVLSGKA
jgi:hypothetical protein